MPAKKKVFRIEAFVRAKPMQPAPAIDAPRLLQSVTRELDAVVSEAAQSTHEILAAAEAIDKAAIMIASNGSGEHGHHAAINIRGGTARIYEACHFHDLVGQRVAKVLDALECIEDRPLVRPADPMINGPKVRGEAGHVSQDEIDAILNSAT